jgi:hypothetical protein
MPQLLAYAVVHHDPPDVLAAEDLEVLHRVLAIELVARTPARDLAPSEAKKLRDALIGERWGDAVAQWIDITGVAVDVYSDLRAWTAAELTAETTEFELQFTPLFAE